MLRTSNNHPVYYEARYQLAPWSADYMPIMRPNGTLVISTDPRKVAIEGNRYVPFPYSCYVVSLHYREASGCYEAAQ